MTCNFPFLVRYLFRKKWPIIGCSKVICISLQFRVALVFIVVHCIVYKKEVLILPWIGRIMHIKFRFNLSDKGTSIRNKLQESSLVPFLRLCHRCGLGKGEGTLGTRREIYFFLFIFSKIVMTSEIMLQICKKDHPGFLAVKTCSVHVTKISWRSVLSSHDPPLFEDFVSSRHVVISALKWLSW